MFCVYGKELTLYSFHSHWLLFSTEALSPVFSLGVATRQHNANTQTESETSFSAPLKKSVCSDVCVCSSYQRSFVCVRVFEVNNLQCEGLLSLGHVGLPSRLKQWVALKLIWTQTECQFVSLCLSLWNISEFVSQTEPSRGASGASTDKKNVTKIGTTRSLLNHHYLIYYTCSSDPAAYHYLPKITLSLKLQVHYLKSRSISAEYAPVNNAWQKNKPLCISFCTDRVHLLSLLTEQQLSYLYNQAFRQMVSPTLSYMVYIKSGVTGVVSFLEENQSRSPSLLVCHKCLKLLVTNSFTMKSLFLSPHHF